MELSELVVTEWEGYKAKTLTLALGWFNGDILELILKAIACVVDSLWGFKAFYKITTRILAF